MGCEYSIFNKLYCIITSSLARKMPKLRAHENFGFYSTIMQIAKFMQSVLNA